MRRRGKFNVVNKLIFLVIFSVLGMSYGQTTPEFLFNEGNKAYNTGDYENAISLYKQTLKMGKHSADVYYNLGNANYRLNKVAESVYYFEKAILMRPKDRDIITNSAFANNMTIDAIEKARKITEDTVANLNGRDMKRLLELLDKI